VKRAPLELKTPDAAADAPTEPNRRLPAKAPPPTVPQRVQRKEELDDDRAAGLPRTISPQAKRVVGVVVALAVILAVVGGLRTLRARQERQIEEQNARVAAGGTRSAKTADVPPPPPVSVERVERAPAAPDESAAPSAVASAAPPVETAAAVEPAATLLPAPAPPPAPVPTLLPAPGPTTEVAPRPPPPTPVAVAPPPTPAPPREAPVDTKPDPAGGSLVVQASRALSKGNTARAVELAKQAVAANPSDATTWLTLGAAYQASGNGGAARAAYQSCISQAHTANVVDCRAMAGQ
jgi:hypothetical protein